MTDEEWVWHGKRKRRVYAVVRVDHEFLDAEARGPGGLAGIAVTQVLPTAEEAASEVRRLNALGAEGRHVPQAHTYYCLATRYFPDGRAGTSQEDDPSD